MKTKEERYNDLLAIAERLFSEGNDARAEVALALCQEIRMGMKHSWDESMMTPEAVIDALQGSGKTGMARSAAIATHGATAVAKAVGSGAVKLVPHGSGFRIALADNLPPEVEL